MFITVELPGVVAHSVYIPPTEQFLLPPLGSRNIPHIVIGDFNCHKTPSRYTSTDNDGKAVDLWAESNTYFSYTMRNCQNHSTVLYGRMGKYVHDPIPHTQHRPICVSVNPVIVAQPTTFRRRFNQKKAKW